MTRISRGKKNSLIYQYKTFLHGSNSELNEEFIVAILCEQMGWTFDEYQEQPVWFIKLLMLKMGLDGEYQKQQMQQK